MNVQDICVANVAKVGRFMVGQGVWTDAASRIVELIPDATARVEALRRLVAAIETYEGGSLRLREYPARAVSVWLGDPKRDRTDVVSVFRLAMVEVAHA